MYSAINSDWSMEYDAPLIMDGHENLIVRACRWMLANEIPCNEWVKVEDFSSHLKECHGLVGMEPLSQIRCRWEGCQQELQRANIIRHLTGVHLRLRWICATCNRSFSRKDTMLAHRKRCFLIRGREAEVAESDYVIFVVGPTGAGKSWFTRQLLNDHDMSQHPSTKNVEAWRCISSISENVVIIDTPSFYSDRNNSDAENTVGGVDMPSFHTDSDDFDVLWFTEKCHSGILFLHSLDSDPKHDDMLILRHLETFAKAFPKEFTVPSRVFVVPTSNPDSTLPRDVLGQRLLQLETMLEVLNTNGNRKWHASMFSGVFKGQQETAWSAAMTLFKDIAETQTRECVPLPMEPALKCVPPQFSDGLLALKPLADLLVKEFRKKATNGDLDAILTLGRTALEFTPADHPRRHFALINLADILFERFKKEGTKKDLDEVITLRQAALEYLVPDDPQRQIILLQLDDCLYERFRKEDSMVDLEEIISLRRAAVESTPPPNRCRLLLNLANALYERFQRQGLADAIDEAISLAQGALELHNPGHPNHALSRDHLTGYLKTKIRKGTARPHMGEPGASSSSDVKQLIRKIVSDKAEKIPLRLLYTSTGALCNRDAQLSHFEGSLQYKRLLSLTSSLNNQQLEMEIIDAVSEYFEFTTLSHKWGSREPLLRDAEGKSIYNLGSAGGQAKLQEFCILALESGFRWAWSDTCCIDKDSSAELQEAIGSMFSWYHQSSLTIVHLSDVSDTGSLADSVWFKRGWTLQELLASQTVLFYTQDWSLYKDCKSANHKADSTLLKELQKATGIAEMHLMGFYPGMDDARSKLHWASGRSTTRVEDVAYSLFGIFNVHLPVLYGESAERALGRLLAEIISSSGDVSVLDWDGKASSFNSCFPANLEPYRMVPDTQLIHDNPIRCNDLDIERAQKLYSDLAGLPRARFVNRRLTLPSTVYPVTAVRLQSSSTSLSRYTYEIHASRLRPLNVTLSVRLGDSAGTYILVRPWHPKSLETLAGSFDDAVWKLLEQLEQPFNALLLKRLPHNEYKRIASDCRITACVEGLASILDSEVLIPEIV